MMEVKLNLKSGPLNTQLKSMGGAEEQHSFFCHCETVYSTGLNQPGEYQSKDYLNPASFILCKTIMYFSSC